MGQDTDTTTAHIWRATDALAREAQNLEDGNPSKAALYHRAMEHFVGTLRNAANGGGTLGDDR